MLDVSLLFVHRTATLPLVTPRSETGSPQSYNSSAQRSYWPPLLASLSAAECHLPEKLEAGARCYPLSLWSQSRRHAVNSFTSVFGGFFAVAGNKP